jgi:hypothetical protein
MENIYRNSSSCHAFIYDYIHNILKINEKISNRISYIFWFGLLFVGFFRRKA